MSEFLTSTVGTITGHPAKTVLDGRVLVVAGKEAPAIASVLRTDLSGFVLVGSSATANLKTLRLRYPNMLLIAEPPGIDAVSASVEDPLALPEPGLLEPFTLTEFLGWQFNAGASIGVIPVRFLEVGDPDSLKAAVTLANAVDRDDCLLLVTAHWRWCQDPNLKQLTAILARSRHPVALALAHQGNPQQETGVALGWAWLARNSPWIMPWRTDLAGFDNMAHGARAAAIGVLPSQRHASGPGITGFSRNPADLSPAVLLAQMLRYVKSSTIQNWYASAPAPVCPCAECGGQPVDRFTDSQEDRNDCYRHNALMMMKMVEQMHSWGANRTGWWRTRLDDAQVAHQAVTAATAVKVPLPKDLASWVKQL